MKHKIIHQIHGCYSKLNAFERVCVERWKLMNPDWDYVFHTDEDLDPYIEHMWPHHLSTYRTMEVVQRAGIQRAAAVYREGGLYADCDLYPTKPANDFVKLDMPIQMFAIEGREHMAHDYLFYAHPHNPVVKRLIDTAFYRTRHTTADSHSGGCWKGWMFYSAGVHCYTDVAQAEELELTLGCCDSAELMAEDPGFWHTLHFSSENWLEYQRWNGSLEAQTREGFGCLNRLKQINGI